MATVVLTTRGTIGDLTPFLSIGSALRARGHDVVLLTHCCFKDVVEQCGLGFVALDTPQELERWSKDQSLLNNPQDLVVFYRRHVLPSLIPEYELIKEQCRVEDVFLVIQHNSRIPGQMVAEALGIPVASICPAASLLLNLPVLEGLYHMLSADLNRIRAQVGLSPVQDWRAWVRSVPRTIASWPEWFAPPDPRWPPGVLPVGFIMHEGITAGPLSQDVRAFLEAGEPPALITGGTSTLLKTEFYTVCVEACRLLGCRAALVTPYEELVPYPLPEGVEWFKNIPFASLMPHLGAVIHHGGTNTLAGALAAAIPQLALAAGFDRPDTAARLQRLGVAEFLLPPHWQPELIARALQRLMSSPAVRQRCRELALRLQDSDPVAVACDAIEDLLASGNDERTVSAQSEKQTSERAKLLQRVKHLSPEKRKMLALQLKKRT